MIFIVIPVFNRKQFTLDCVNSISLQKYKDYKIIVVDDGSTDGTKEALNEKFPEVTVISGNGNLWWAAATNKGVEYALKNTTALNKDFVLTLNNDLIIPEDYLSKMHAFALENNKSLIGSISIDINNQEVVEFCGVRWNELFAKQVSLAKEINYSFRKLTELKTNLHSDFLSGRGTLIPLSLFSEIGFYDHVNFPQYAADDDFSLRAKRKGYRLLLKPDIFVRSHVYETGTNLVKVQYSFMYLKNLFFSIKSPINLKIRYRFAIKNSRYGFFYFIVDSVRIFASLMRGFIVQAFFRK